MLHVELIERAKNRRNNIVPITSVHTVSRDYEAYTSMFPYDELIVHHVKANGTVSDFKGKYHCRYVFLDFDDSENLQNSLEDARKAFMKLCEIGVNENLINIYFSGGKGFHIALSAELFGGIEPGNDLPERVKRFAVDIFSNLKSFDDSIYNANRFFRLPNSKHEKSGLYKIPLTAEELLNLNIEAIKKLAVEPREDFSYYKPNKILVCEELKRIFQIAQTRPQYTKQEKTLLDEMPKNDLDLFALAVEKAHKKYSVEDYFARNRNNFIAYLSFICCDLGVGEKGNGETTLTLIKEYCRDTLADNISTWNERNVSNTVSGIYKRKEGTFGSKKAYLKESQGKKSVAEYQYRMQIESRIDRLVSTNLSLREVLEFILSYNNVQEQQLDESEIYELVYGSSKRKNKVVRADDDWGKSLSEMAQIMQQRFANARPGVGIGIDAIDELEGRDYQSKVVGIIGAGGTHKSRLLKDVSIHVGANGERFAYLSQEDSDINQFRRYLDTIFMSYPIKKDGEIVGWSRASDVIKSEMIRKPEHYKYVQQQLEPFGDSIIIDGKAGLTKQDIQDFCKHQINKFGRLDFLGVDGMSALGGSKNDEIKDTIENSFVMKELAKEFNMCVMPLNHVPSDVPLTKRDLYWNIRGGRKIMDNFDIFICHSFIMDEENSTPGNTAYYDDLIWLHYWGKRTTGKKMDIIMKFDPQTQSLVPSGYSPKDFITV